MAGVYQPYDEVNPGQNFPPGDVIKNFPIHLVNDLIKQLNVEPGTNIATVAELFAADNAKVITSGPLGATWKKGADIIPNAAMVIGDGGYFKVTGAGIVTSMTFSVPANGRQALLYFDSAVALNGSANFVVPGGTMNINAGDMVSVVQDDTGKTIVSGRFSTTTLSAVPLASTTEVLTGTDTQKAVTPDSLAALWEQGANVTAAATITLGEGGYFGIIGTGTSISDIDFANDKAGRRAWLLFGTPGHTLVNSATLIIPGSADIAVGTGDRVEIISQGSDVVRVLSVTKNDGKPLVMPTKADVGLGNVDNTSDANKPVSTAQAAAIALKADIASPTLTGDPKAPTASFGDNDTSIATTAFVQSAVGTATTKASTTEVLTGTDTTKTVTPDALASLWEMNTTPLVAAATVSVGEGGYFTLDGPGTITDIDFATDKAGRVAVIRANDNTITLTNGANLVLPGGANIVTKAGDLFTVVSEGSDRVRIISYTRADGRALIGSGLTISDTAPAGALSGDLWWESDSGKLYVYYNDGSSSQWVEIFAPPVSVPVLDQGQYTPTITLVANLDSVTPNSETYWTRQGDFVDVSGSLSYDATAAVATLTQFRMSLPIVSDLSGSAALSGVGTGSNAGPTQLPVEINGDGATDTALFSWTQTTATAGRVMNFRFRYKVA